MSVQTNDRVAMQVFLPRDVVEKVDKSDSDASSNTTLKGCPSCPL
jgi:hypothetical protein